MRCTQCMCHGSCPAHGQWKAFHCKGLSAAAPSDLQHELYLSTSNLCGSSSSNSVPAVRYTSLQLTAADAGVSC